MHRFLLCSLLFVFCSVAFAQSPTPDPVLGTRPEAFSARSLSLGRTFLTGESGAPALFGNPATLANMSKGAAAKPCKWGEFQLDLGADVSRVKETRSYPFYDSFDGVLAYNSYAINDHLFSKLDGGIAWKAPQSKLDALVLSLGTYSTYRFDYRYHEEVRSRFSNGGVQDLKLGENRLDIDGDLRSISLGAACKEEKFSAGFGVSILSGEWSYNKGTYYASPDSADLVQHVDYSPDGTPAEFNLGFCYDLNDRITLGARALLPTGDFKFKADSRSTIGDSVRAASGVFTATYPSHFALGVQYRPEHEFRPTLMLETEIHTFEDVSDELSNTFEIRAGAEQIITPGAPMRLGFVYYTHPEDDSRATALFTAGVGFRLQKMTADFGVEMGKMNYTSADMFPQSLFGDDNRVDYDRVETSLFRGLITLRYAL